MDVAERIRSMKGSPTVAMNALAQEMKRKGVAVTNLSAGEPDFPAPDAVKEAAIKAVQDNKSYYTAVPGTIDLREAICRKLERDNHVRYEPGEVIVSNGAKESLYLIAQVLIDPGSEVLIPAPYWVSYPAQVRLAGGKPVIVPADQDSAFKVTPDTLEKYTTDKTRYLIMNSPSNPTGAYYHRDEIEAIAQWALKKGIYIVSDDIYEKLIYDGHPYATPAELSDEVKASTITVNGLSKAYSMTGWRVGYAAGPREVIAAMGRVQSQGTTHANSVAQAASVVALDPANDAEIERRRQEFDKRRQYVVKRLQSIDRISTNVPQGAFYIFPRTVLLLDKHFGNRQLNNSVDVCTYFLEEQKLAMVPGGGFGDDGHVRISYAYSMDVLEEGLDKFEEGVGKLVT